MNSIDNATLVSVLQTARQRLQLADNPAFEAELLLAHALGKPRAYLHTWPHQVLDTGILKNYEDLVTQRAAGVPVAYLTGKREFWSLELAITRDTLIPRPETERLVELALHHIPEDRPYRIADLGTGSGAIALAIASERPHSRLIATDIAAATLAIARTNAALLQLNNVEFRLGDWTAALGTDNFDMIVSNPPYVRAGDPHLSQGDLPHEPELALVGGDTGAEMIEIIANNARTHLRPGGWLLLEHGYDQAALITELLNTLGYCNITSHQDHAGNNRVIEAQSR